LAAERSGNGKYMVEKCLCGKKTFLKLIIDEKQIKNALCFNGYLKG
jgi:hypothetical protein